MQSDEWRIMTDKLLLLENICIKRGRKWKIYTIGQSDALGLSIHTKKMKSEHQEKATAFENTKQGKINKPCPQIARSSGRDHHCAVVLPDICFAAWLCTVVYVEKALCVYHLWPRSMGFWQLAASSIVWWKKREPGGKMSCSLQHFLSLVKRSADMQGDELVNVSFITIFAAEQSGERAPDMKHVWNVSTPCFSTRHVNQASCSLGFMRQRHMEEIWFGSLEIVLKFSSAKLISCLKWSCVPSESAPDVNWTNVWQGEVRMGPIYF